MPASSRTRAPNAPILGLLEPIWVRNRLEADFLDKVHQKPYEAAKAGMNLYALNADKPEVASALDGG